MYSEDNRVVWVLTAAFGLSLALLACSGCDHCGANVGVGNSSTEGVCVIGPEGGICNNGDCVLLVPPGALSDTWEISVSEVVPTDPDIASVTLGPRLCVVGPDGLSFAASADLRIRLNPQEIPESYTEDELIGFATSQGDFVPMVGGRYDPPAAFFSVPITEDGSFGVTVAPSRIVARSVLGEELQEIYDEATFFRNISSQPIYAAFHDGQRFYVASGGRLLIYEDGIPSSSTAMPDVVLGKPDLVLNPQVASSSNTVGAIKSIWSDGQRLVISVTNRILIWLTIPVQDYWPADVVLGQSSFASTEANAGGLNASSLNMVHHVFSDGERLFAADLKNNRWLIWDPFPMVSGAPASLVIGQPDFKSNTADGGSIPANQPKAIYANGSALCIASAYSGTLAFCINGLPTTNNPAHDFTLGVNTVCRFTDVNFCFPAAMSGFAHEGMTLRDGGRRVAVWTVTPTASGVPCDFVLGRPNPFLGGGLSGGITASSLTEGGYAGFFAAEGRPLLAPDITRVLIWDSPPGYDFAPADGVFGQPGFTTAEAGVDYRSVGAHTLAHPWRGSSNGTMAAIADRSNNRVALYGLPYSTGDDAQVVVGQPDGTSFLLNSGRAPDASTLSGPEDALLDGTRLIVADSQNHRVLIWNSVPTQDGQAADVVIGQPDFESNRPNHGNADLDGDRDCDADASGFFYPTSVASDGTRLWVSDRMNHRVVLFDPIPDTNGASAMAVLGQPDLTSNDPNGGAGVWHPRADGLWQPAGLALDLDAQRLYVADEENNRVVGFDVAGSFDATADIVLGQPDFTTLSNPNFITNSINPGQPADPPPSASTFEAPLDVEVAEGALLVADTRDHRVAVYTSIPVASGAAPDLYLGQQSSTESYENALGVNSASLAGPAGIFTSSGEVWVCDSSNNRVIIHGASPGGLSTFREADRVMGQVDFGTRGLNQGIGISAILDQPGDVCLDGNRLYVADTAHSRVLVFFQAPETDHVLPDLVLGQTSLSGTQENRGGLAGPSTMNRPEGLACGNGVLVVADSGNHRLLLWNTQPDVDGAEADHVIGQPDGQSSEPNGGAGPTHAGPLSFYLPTSLALQGGGLVVADTGNNRVLSYSALPTQPDAVPDAVLGQNDFETNLPNHGSSAANSDTLSSPRGITFLGDTWLAVADSVNNRVLLYSLPLQPGQIAEAVLGQPDFTSRQAHGVQGEIGPGTLSYPTGLATDGVFLFVSDTNDNRVLGFLLPLAETAAEALIVIGQPDFTNTQPLPTREGLAGPSGLAALAGSFHETTLWVADSRNDRAVLFARISRLTAAY